MPQTSITTPTQTTRVAARGKVVAAQDGKVLFGPAGTSYELHLLAASYDGPLDTLTDGLVRVTARKIYTVPSGGNFITPIFGPPRIIQGRVRALDETGMVVQAGCPVIVDFPPENTAFEMSNGPITIGALVNVVAQPGAAFERVRAEG